MILKKPKKSSKYLKIFLIISLIFIMSIIFLSIFFSHTGFTNKSKSNLNNEIKTNYLSKANNKNLTKSIKNDGSFIKKSANIPQTSDNFQKFYNTSDGDLWAITTSSVFRLHNGTWQDIPHDGDDFDFPTINQIYETKHGSLENIVWLATLSGLYYFDSKNHNNEFVLLDRSAYRSDDIKTMSEIYNPLAESYSLIIEDYTNHIVFGIKDIDGTSGPDDRYSNLSNLLIVSFYQLNNNMILIGLDPTSDAGKSIAIARYLNSEPHIDINDSQPQYFNDNKFPINFIHQTYNGVIWLGNNTQTSDDQTSINKSLVYVNQQINSTWFTNFQNTTIQTVTSEGDSPTQNNGGNDHLMTLNKTESDISLGTLWVATDKFLYYSTSYPTKSSNFFDEYWLNSWTKVTDIPGLVNDEHFISILPEGNGTNLFCTNKGIYYWNSSLMSTSTNAWVRSLRNDVANDPNVTSTDNRDILLNNLLLKNHSQNFNVLNKNAITKITINDRSFSGNIIPNEITLPNEAYKNRLDNQYTITVTYNDGAPEQEYYFLNKQNISIDEKNLFKSGGSGTGPLQYLNVYLKNQFSAQPYNCVWASGDRHEILFGVNAIIQEDPSVNLNASWYGYLDTSGKSINSGFVKTYLSNSITSDDDTIILNNDSKQAKDVVAVVYLDDYSNNHQFFVIQIGGTTVDYRLSEQDPLGLLAPKFAIYYYVLIIIAFGIIMVLVYAFLRKYSSMTSGKKLHSKNIDLSLTNSVDSQHTILTQNSELLVPGESIVGSIIVSIFILIAYPFYLAMLFVLYVWVLIISLLKVITFQQK